MSVRPKIIFHLAGHDFHPVYEQAAAVTAWLGPAYWCHTAESLAALEHVDECDLVVFLGMYYRGWEGRYRPPGLIHRRKFERYVASGRPLILGHGAAACYDDWPRFRELTGFSWPAGRAAFALLGDYHVRVASEPHPVIDGVDDHVLVDAPPVGVRVASDLSPRVHAHAEAPERSVPLVVTAEGGRVEGAGRTALLGQGHDMRGFLHPMTRRVWLNTVRWCLNGS